MVEQRNATRIDDVDASGKGITGDRENYGLGESGTFGTPLLGRGESGTFGTPLLGRGESGTFGTPLFGRGESGTFGTPLA